VTQYARDVSDKTEKPRGMTTTFVEDAVTADREVWWARRDAPLPTLL